MAQARQRLCVCWQGLLDITEGEATILGFDLKSKAEDIKPHVGYMAQQFSLYGELSVVENLQFFAELFDVTSKDQRERTERLLSFAGLTEFRDRRAANLIRRDAEETGFGMYLDP